MYAGDGSSWVVSSASATPAIHTGTNTTSDMIAVRRPLLGTTIARMNTVNAAYMSVVYPAGRRSLASNALAANAIPVPAAYTTSMPYSARTDSGRRTRTTRHRNAITASSTVAPAKMMSLSLGLMCGYSSYIAVRNTSSATKLQNISLENRVSRVWR